MTFSTTELYILDIQHSHENFLSYVDAKCSTACSTDLITREHTWHWWHKSSNEKWWQQSDFISKQYSFSEWTITLSVHGIIPNMAADTSIIFKIQREAILNKPVHLLTAFTQIWRHFSFKKPLSYRQSWSPILLIWPSHCTLRTRT